MITPYVQDNEMDIVFDAYDEDEIDYEIGCTNEDCGNVMKFISLDTGDLEETFTAAIMYKSYVEKDPLVLMFDLAPSCKNCGSKLYIKIYNEQLKQFLEDYSDKVIRDFIVRKALGGN